MIYSLLWVKEKSDSHTLSHQDTPESTELSRKYMTDPELNFAGPIKGTLK